MPYQRNQVIAAMDDMTFRQTSRMVRCLRPHGCRIKVGMQLHGGFASTRRRLQDFLPGSAMMLDLKRHDIPQTVYLTARDDCRAFHPAFYTLNLPWNHPSFALTVQKLSAEFPDTVFLGITALTSLFEGQEGKPNDISLASGGRFTKAAEAVAYYAQFATSFGSYPNVGLVCSPLEITALRQNSKLGHLILVTPGIRPAGSTANDQARIATPLAALQAGANFLVIGRPITQAPDAEVALEEIYTQIGAPPLALAA